MSVAQQQFAPDPEFAHPLRRRRTWTLARCRGGGGGANRLRSGGGVHAGADRREDVASGLRGPAPEPLDAGHEVRIRRT